MKSQIIKYKANSSRMSFAGCLIFTILVSLQINAEEKAGTSIGANQPKGSSLNVVPWLDFPVGKVFASTEWRGAPEKTTLAVVSFDGKKVTFEDENFFMSMDGLRMDYQNSLCRSTLLRIAKAVQFPCNTADITSRLDDAWVRLIHGAVAGGAGVKVVYAAHKAKKELPVEILFPENESLETYKKLMESKNANARQSGVLALRWMSTDKNRKELIEYLIRVLKDQACGVRAGSAWVIGQLQIEEAVSELQKALRDEKDPKARQTFDKVLKAMTKVDVSIHVKEIAWPQRPRERFRTFKKAPTGKFAPWWVKNYSLGWEEFIQSKDSSFLELLVLFKNTAQEDREVKADDVKLKYGNREVSAWEMLQVGASDDYEYLANRFALSSPQSSKVRRLRQEGTNCTLEPGKETWAIFIYQVSENLHNAQLTYEGRCAYQIEKTVNQRMETDKK